MKKGWLPIWNNANIESNPEHSYPVSFARRGLTDGWIYVFVEFKVRGNPLDGIKLLGSSISTIGNGSYEHLPTEPHLQRIPDPDFSNDPSRFVLYGTVKTRAVGDPPTFNAVPDVIEAGKMEIDWTLKVPMPRNADGVEDKAYGRSITRWQRELACWTGAARSSRSVKLGDESGVSEDSCSAALINI